MIQRKLQHAFASTLMLMLFLSLPAFLYHSSSVVHVTGVNEIQSPTGTSQNLTQISRQLNAGQVWTGSRPPFQGQVL